MEEIYILDYMSIPKVREWGPPQKEKFLLSERKDSIARSTKDITIHFIIVW